MTALTDLPRPQTPQPSRSALVPFVSVANMMRLIHRVGLDRMLALLAERIEADFRRWPEFDKTPRVASHSPQGVIEVMPTADGQRYGFKYVNGHPCNTRAGLQTVTAFGLLADVGTGYPTLLCEMTLLTALRTAAMSAVATRHLAPRGATVMAMIGNGAQAVFQARALAALCGITQVRLYDTDAAATRTCADHLRAAGLDVICCADTAEAVQGAHVITTCTADKRRATILGANHIGPGVHVNAIGGDCPGKTELAPELLRRGDIFVEYTPQTRIEGDIQQLPADHPVTELWQVMTGQAPGRRDARQITLFDGVGFAVEDFSALCVVQALLQDAPDLAEPLDLLADPDDPRDLYGMLMRAR